jgi:hypothetical protein
MKSPNSSGRLEFAGPEIKVGLDAAKAAPKQSPAPMSKRANKMEDMEPKMPKDKKMIMSAPSPKPKRLPKRK